LEVLSMESNASDAVMDFIHMNFTCQGCAVDMSRRVNTGTDDTGRRPVVNI
jgi:hypothetical protein